MKALPVLPWLLMMLGLSLPARAAGPPVPDSQAAYRMILSQADVNKDGRLSAAECQAMWKDKTVAQKNCAFWDVDKDGLITEAEYVRQTSSFGKKR